MDVHEHHRQQRDVVRGAEGQQDEELRHGPLAAADRGGARRSDSRGLDSDQAIE
jgi:hypothetical protein